MLRLIKNKQQAEAAQTKPEEKSADGTTDEKKEGNADGEKFTLKKQSSKEVVEIRKSKSKENVGNVFSLKAKSAAGKGGKKELQVPN